jgi:murein DD-endopeptidase MepM/ murein hydrolase activator NlpD
LKVLVGILILLALVGLTPVGDTPRAAAQAPTPTPPPLPVVKPFGLPFNTPPGPNTWLLGQAYGNTTGAYQQRRAFYSAGQGLHFGLDFSTPCGTPVVAIGDGVVVGGDGPWGSAPHNLMLNHENGWLSMYGHLFETPKLKAGTRVKKGDVVAMSGDPDSTCHSRPHLHLEIRDAKQTRFVNPVTLIEADWDTLASFGQFGRGFERDLNNPRQWQTLYDQPDALRGGPFLNDYTVPFPPAFNFR